MHKERFFHRARVRAPIDVVWDVFTNHERMPEFTNTPCRIIRPGEPERNGLGCIRRLGVLGWEVDEVINIWKPHELYGYHVLNSEVIDFHQGVIRFWPLPTGGYEWVYDMQMVASEKGIELAATEGLSWRQYIGPHFPLWMNDLEAECERRADGERIPSPPPPTREEALFRL